MPELLAAQFVGGTASLVAGATAIPPATAISLSADGASADSYWPPGERWALHEPEAAQDAAETALLSSLAERLATADDPVLGLTGGLDSLVTGVALNELGIGFTALTFGDPAWPDVRSPRHRRAARGRALRQPDRADRRRRGSAPRRRRRALARGCVPLGIGRIDWPAGIGTWVTGGAGETGRAFYYRSEAAASPDPAPEEVTATLAAALTAPIRGAGRPAVEGVSGAAAEWTQAARATGVDGWRVLDVVYAEQRVQRWLRGMTTHSLGVLVPAFGAPDVQRALVSLPLRERAADGFHRSFLARRAPALLPATTPEPAPRRSLLARRGRQTAAPARARADGELWPAHPDFRAWVADEVLGSPSLTATMGTRWCLATRRGFLAGDPEAESLALWAAGPIAFDRALRELS